MNECSPETDNGDAVRAGSHRDALTGRITALAAGVGAVYRRAERTR